MKTPESYPWTTIRLPEFTVGGPGGYDGSTAGTGREARFDGYRDAFDRIDPNDDPYAELPAMETKAVVTED